MHRHIFVCVLFVITCALACISDAVVLAIPMSNVLPMCDDCSKSHRLTLDPPFFMLNHTIYNSATVSTNRYISLWQQNSNTVTDSDDSDDGVPSFAPDTKIRRPLLAVYWVDSTTLLPRGTKQGRVHYTFFTENSTQNNASRYLLQVSAKVSKVMKTRFTARWAFVVFWESLTYSGGDRHSTRNSFQALLTSGGHRSYVIYMYDRLEYSTAKGDVHHAMAGIHFGHGGKQLWLPGSLTPSIVDLATDPRQIEKGTYGFRVDNFRLSLEDIPLSRNTRSVTTPASSTEHECIDSDRGYEYGGVVDTTVSGLTCQEWTSQTPHKHNCTVMATTDDHSSYCRNAQSNPECDEAWPWCFTTDRDKRWDYCHIPRCAELPECVHSDRGYEYRGVVNKTVSGYTCQAWTSQMPHKHNCNGFQSNHCRNDGSNPECDEAWPWCFTTEPGVRWDYCEIPRCTGSEPTVVEETTTTAHHVPSVEETTRASRMSEEMPSTTVASSAETRFRDSNNAGRRTTLGRMAV